MTVTFDAVGPSSSGATTGSGGGSSLSWSHVGGGTANYALVTTVQGGSAKGTDTCTFSGSSMSLLARVYSNEAGSNTAGYVSLWGLANPATGTVTVLYTPQTSGVLIAGSVTYTGVGSVGTPIVASGNSSAPSASITGTTSGSIIGGGICSGSPVSSPTQTSRWSDNVDPNSAADNAAMQDAASSGGTITLAWTILGGDFWGLVAVELLASGGTPAAATPSPVVSPSSAAIQSSTW